MLCDNREIVPRTVETAPPRRGPARRRPRTRSGGGDRSHEHCSFHCTRDDESSLEQVEELMIGKIANLVGYTKAPKATYVLKHPVKGTKALLAAKGAKSLVRGRTGLALGALAAIPVGVWAATQLGSG